MVYETINGKDHLVFQICSPRKPETCANLHRYFFRAFGPGKMQAYEYTTYPSMEAENHSALVAGFADEVIRRRA